MNRFLPYVVAALALGLAAWRRRRRSATPRARTFTLSRFVRGDVALIAVREVRQRARGRIFRVVTVLMLLGVAAAIVVPVLTKGHHPRVTVGVVGELSDQARAVVDGGAATADTTVSVRAEPDQATADRDLLAGRVSLVVVGTQRVVVKTGLSSTDVSTTARVARAIAAGLGEVDSIQAAGLTPAQISALRAAHPLPITGLRAAPRRSSGRSAATLGVVLLFILLTQYNTWTLVGVMEEKASRVVEVLLATVRPVQLLAGKVIGIGLLVFAQAGLVVATALGLAAAVGSDLLHGAGPSTVVSTLLWLVLGYAFYSWVYAAAGSLAERQDQVQSLAVPIAIPMIVGYITALTVAGNGSSSTFFDVLAYLPPTAPFAMPMLVGLGLVAWWQVALSAAISVVATIGVARLAAAVYRRAVLRTGRRVKLRDVLHASAG
jgi:ABC-2 type transport system permease protein